MQLTNQQVQEMQKKGLSFGEISQIAQQRGYQMPDSRNTLQQVTSGVNKVFAGGKVGEAIGTLGGYGITAAKEKLGYVPKGTTAQYDLSAPNPLQVAGDIAKGATQIAGLKMPLAGSILGKTAQFGAFGGASGLSSGIAEGKTAGETLKMGARDATVGALTGFTFGVLGKAAGGLKKTGERIQYGVIKPSQADVKDGFKIETVNKYNLGGNLKDTASKTDAKLQELSSQLNAKLASSNASVNLDQAFKKTAERLMGSKMESFGSNAQMEGALEKLREEILAVSGKNGLVSIPEAQIIKRASGHHGAWVYGIPTPEATASQKVYNTFYNELKNTIETQSPTGVREINKQISELIPVMNAVIRRIPIEQRNGPISLTDIISLTGGTIEPTALTVSLLNRASKSGTVGNILAKSAGGIGKGIRGVERITQGIISR